MCRNPPDHKRGVRFNRRETAGSGVAVGPKQSKKWFVAVAVEQAPQCVLGVAGVVVVGHASNMDADPGQQPERVNKSETVGS